MREIILASNSPRRRELLGQFISCSVVPSKVVENHDHFHRAEQLAMALSFEKGYSVARDYPQNIVLAADTVVCIEGNILGKPKDGTEAKKMIQILSGKTHQVITGYSIFCLEKKIKYVDYDETKVTFKALSQEKINEYILTESYATKAGAYGIQDIGSLLVSKIDGDYNNVVGLPISKIADQLEDLFQFRLLKEVVENE